MIFGKGTSIRTRLDTLIETGDDLYEGQESFEPLEKVIRALATGEPNPYAFIGARGGKTYDTGDDIRPGLVPRVLVALDELFMARDRGEFSVSAKDYLDVEFKEECQVREVYMGAAKNKTFKKGEKFRASMVKGDGDKYSITIGSNKKLENVPRNKVKVW